ncbi:UxaA family hydrolase [Isoptericola variabilis]|uniref:Altronate dehydratase n=1 Tax=Isoptericola variabilis (strain 225) TaxID=743718 RepID=F6FUP6_ISOV2|nr:altronate dehydratase family protein [Isoptericola variabilis]AEG43307.1 Altronate dehydratase [Isoptericola variabilis 225]TWH35242.1 altronate hydrolase [Isoptericola variabilis J7]
MNDLLVLRDGDDVAVATRDLAPGDEVSAPGAGTVVVRDAVARGHKVALRAVARGAAVHKYGQVIGVATADVAPGEHVHVHNLGFDPGEREAPLGGVHTELRVPDGPRPTFRGYRRADGRVGTRNYVAILTSVNCSASTARMIADQFRGAALDEFENVDGVIALTHTSGCGLVPESEGGQMLLRTLRGYAAHPNVAGLLVLGLGCEMVPGAALAARSGSGSGTVTDLGMPGVGAPDPGEASGLLASIPDDTVVRSLTIQESGGVRASVRAGVAAVREMLPEVNARQRVECDVSELVLGLNCGGSDGYSGITANPALGWASDRLVAYGGTSVLAETPEVYGAEHLLTARATSPGVAKKLLDRIEWWRGYVAAGQGTLDNNPSPGNKAGGLTTILEKSLGAVAKGGQADLAAVYDYAEPITDRGFTFMDTPGYDPVSVTGLVAGGANVVVFTTGRGSVFGCRPTPSIKVATNTPMYDRMAEDMDLNAGRIVDGTATVDDVGAEILAKILAVASGEKTVSEELEIGAEEFIPWHVGAVT